MSIRQSKPQRDEAQLAGQGQDHEGSTVALPGMPGVRLRLPNGMTPTAPTGSHTEARERPEIGDDPRSGPMRDVPPLGGI